MERTEMMYTINSQLEFKIKVRTRSDCSPLTSWTARHSGGISTFWEMCFFASLLRAE